MVACVRLVGALLAITLAGASMALAQSKGPVAEVVYAKPTNSLHQALHDRLQSERWLERMQGVLGMFRLPRPVTLKVESCGEVDAYYARRTLGLCYEYLQVVLRRIEAGQLPAWVTADEALAGAFVDAILHEFAHALFEQHKIPLLGREEEAADQLAVFIVTEIGGAEAAGLVRGTAHLYLSWIGFFQSRPGRHLASGGSEREARAHPTAAQRLYNLVCMALGSDRSRYAALARAVDLPETRAEDCPAERAQLAHAWSRLVKPHVVAANEAEARRQLLSFLVRR